MGKASGRGGPSALSSLLSAACFTTPAAAAAAAAAAAPEPPFFCGVLMNDTARMFSFAEVASGSGAVRDLLALPMLDEFGLGVSAGARGGRYFTITGNASEQTEVLVADVGAGGAGQARFVTLGLPPQYSLIEGLYGVAMLDVDDARPGDALAMVMGFAADSRRYAFLGVMNGDTGAVGAADVIYNLTDAYRQWVYLYSGISAWDAENRLYYLSAVTGERDETSLFVFNTSDRSSGASPLAQLAFPNPPGMYMGLAVSRALAALHNPGGPGLLALVDDDGNSAAALWLLIVPRNGTAWPQAAWLPLYQYPARTLESAGNDLLELGDDGVTAFSVFYDDHEPIANQIVSAVDLSASPPREVARTIVRGSEDGSAAIADIAACPIAARV